MKTFIVIFEIGGRKEAESIQDAHLVIKYDTQKDGYDKLTVFKVREQLNELLGEDNHLYCVYDLNDFMDAVNNQDFDNLSDSFISYVTAEMDFEAQERTNLYNNIMDYFSDLKEAHIEAMIPNLISFVTGRAVKNEVVVTKIGKFYHLYEESGEMVEGGFISHDEAKQWAIDNNLKVVDNFFVK